MATHIDLCLQSLSPLDHGLNLTQTPPQAAATSPSKISSFPPNTHRRTDLRNLSPESIPGNITLPFRRRTRSRYLKVRYYTKHHLTSEDTPSVAQFGCQVRFQSNTRNNRNLAWALACNGFVRAHFILPHVLPRHGQLRRLSYPTAREALSEAALPTLFFVHCSTT